MNDTRELDLLDFLIWLRKRIRAVFAVCALSAVLGALITLIFVGVEYTATTCVYVLNRRSDSAVSASDYSLANYLVRDYAVLIGGENVTSEVIAQLALDTTPSQLQKQISVSAVDSTRILQIEVVDSDPQRAADIANCIREVASRQIKEIMDVDAVNLVYEAAVPQEKSGPHLLRNAAVAALIGCVLVFGVLLILYAADDSLRTQEDVERYLGLNVLAVVPQSPAPSRRSGEDEGNGRVRWA